MGTWLGTHLWTTPWAVMGVYLITETVWPWIKRQTFLRPLVQMFNDQVQSQITNPTTLDELDDDEAKQ